MSSETNVTPSPSEQSPPRSRTNRSALFAYMVALFSVAFLLLVMSFFMQQRRNDQLAIEEGLEQNRSAMQITRSVQEQNETLRGQVSELQEANETLTAQAEEQGKTVLALDWLWRIEREYFQRHYTSARQLIRDFEATGLNEFLPAESLVDPEYRTPLEQYQAIYDLLF